MLNFRISYVQVDGNVIYNNFSTGRETIQNLSGDFGGPPLRNAIIVCESGNKQITITIPNNESHKAKVMIKDF